PAQWGRGGGTSPRPTVFASRSWSPPECAHLTLSQFNEVFVLMYTLLGNVRRVWLTSPEHSTTRLLPGRFAPRAIFRIGVCEKADHLGRDVNPGHRSESTPARDGVHLQDVTETLRPRQQVHSRDRSPHGLGSAKSKPLLFRRQLHDFALSTL